MLEAVVDLLEGLDQHISKGYIYTAMAFSLIVEFLNLRARINKLLSEETGQPIERIKTDTHRDYWMTAEESVEYGLISSIIASSADLPA